MESNGIHQRSFFSRELSKSDSDNLRLNSSGMQIKMEEGLGKQRRVRFIKKSGHCNVSHKNLKDKPRRFLADIFTTGVDLQWRYNLLVFSLAFIISWILFGLIYWAESYRHGDFTPRNRTNSDFRGCIETLNIDHPFASTFLFSLETQTTIGYGYRHVTEECWITITIVVLQSVFGCILDAFMIGLIMAKISRPKKRAETLLFSRNAVISMRDGQLCFMVRVGNLRKSHLVEATIRMQYVHSRETLEGEYIPVEQIDLKLDLKNDSDRLFLVTPQTICHPIDKDSPMWNLKPQDLENEDFEIIVILEGMVEATGMTTQARASYLPHEILWGYRFQNMISLSRHNAYKVDFKKFNNTYAPVSKELIDQSAKELCDAEQSRLHVLPSHRHKRALKKTNSDSSSSRSSSVSNHPYNLEEKDSGYTALDTTALSGSKSSLNKAMTSTTSLSDDSDHVKNEVKRDDKPKRDSVRSTSSSLIDLSSPRALEQTQARDKEEGWAPPEPAEVPGTCDPVQTPPASEDGKLLIELEPDVNTSQSLVETTQSLVDTSQSLVNQTQNTFSEPAANNNSFTKVLDNNKPLCV